MRVLPTIIGLMGMLFCLQPIHLQAQDTLRGTIIGVDPNEETPLIGASIYWENTTSGTISDASGEFAIPRSVGQNLLQIRYLEWEGAFDLSNDSTGVVLRMEFSEEIESESELDNVVISDRLKSSGVSKLDPRGVELIRDSEFRKAACCNLSESFETNPSVDASFSDAVTGEKQIKMLGLSGIFVSITSENMPLMSGLHSVSGLSHIPSTWVNSLQLSKGTGSVANGFEGIAGQINIDHHLPGGEDLLVLNGYANLGSRVEGNAIFDTKISEVVSTNVMGHVANVSRINDRNGDGFLDMPLKNDWAILNRWKFQGIRGLMGQVNIKGLRFQTRSGQSNYFSQDQVATIPYYHYENSTEEFQAFAKMGYVSRKDPLASIGTQWMASQHSHRAVFGGRLHNARQRSLYGNIITQYPLSGEKHMMKTGINSRLDDFGETIRWTSLDSANFDRLERTGGLFSEYTYAPSPRMTLVVGLRGDIHNYYGTFMTPRAHFRYGLTDNTTIRLSAGRGQRSPNVLTDQLGLLVSSRTWEFNSSTNLPGYGFLPEIGWNFGGSLTQNFNLDYRPGSIRADFFRTQFTQQVIVDREDPSLVSVYPLEGNSFANSFLLEVSYELIKRMDLRLAYRFYDVRAKYNTGLLAQPFTSKHRGFLNLGYQTRKHGWSFDYTLQFVGPQRIPGDEAFETPSFFLMNAHINKEIGRSFEIYVGSENLLDYRQTNPIIDADQPFGPGFDASLVWGPIFGRMAYAGFRLKIKKKN